MSSRDPIWIKEPEVVEMMNLCEAIEALEAGLRLQAEGSARNMTKAHLRWDGSNTLHAVGGVFEDAQVVGTKTWAHTASGATPLLVLWDAVTGALLAVIEAFALGQLRTGAMSGVATRWMAANDAHVVAIIGTGHQALSQLAAVASVRDVRMVRVWGRNPEGRRKFTAAAETLGYGFTVEIAETVQEAASEAKIVTLVTRANEPFFTSAMAGKGTHINAVGAITPERQEFTRDVLERAGLVAADDPAAARKLSAEFGKFYTDDTWTQVRAVSDLVRAGAGRPQDCDLSVFKAMGMGLSDLALGIRLYGQAVDRGLGRPFNQPTRKQPRLGPQLSGASV